jgi:hypothetical protein
MNPSSDVPKEKNKNFERQIFRLPTYFVLTCNTHSSPDIRRDSMAQREANDS